MFTATQFLLGLLVRQCKEDSARSPFSSKDAIEQKFGNLFYSATLITVSTTNPLARGLAIDIAQLLQACRRHEPLAWEAFVRMYQDRLYAFCYGYLRSTVEAEEVAQEAFVQMFRNLHQFRGEVEGLEPWMFTITRNCCIDRQRHNNVRLPTASKDAFIEDEWRTDIETDPEQALATQQHQQLLYRALQETSDETRDLILLRDIQGLKIEEVAHILGLPVGTVKSRCHRAKLELAKIVLRLGAEHIMQNSAQGATP